MDYLSITEIWKYLRWLPKFILRRLFSKQRLADLVLIDVQARHESVLVDLGEVSTYTIWFQIINMTPFEIELDRAEFDFMCAGAKITKQYIKKERFKAGQVASFFIEGEISSPKADQIARLHDQNRSSISLHCEFNCGLHEPATTWMESMSISSMSRIGGNAWNMHNQCRHGDALYIAPSAPFQGRACCRRYD